MRGISSNTSAKLKSMLSQDFFQLVLERVNDLVMVTDREGLVLYVSPSFSGHLPGAGIKPGSRFLEMPHPSDRALQEKLFREIIRKGKAMRSEFRLRSGDGGVHHIEWEGFRVIPQSGDAPCVVIIARDITRRKESENELRLLGHALSCTKDCFCLTDLQNNFLFVNPAFCETYGYAADELLGKNVSVVRSPKHPTEQLAKILPATLAGGWNGEILNRRKDGSELLVELWTSV